MPNSRTKLKLRQAKSVAARTQPAKRAGQARHQTVPAFIVAERRDPKKQFYIKMFSFHDPVVQQSVVIVTSISGMPVQCEFRGTRMSSQALAARSGASVRVGFSAPMPFFKNTYYYRGLLG
jgi:hypothetical protein